MTEETLDLLFNITGTVGVALILLGYWLIQVNRLTSADLSYSVINFIGAVLLPISLMRFWNLPSVIIEVCWVGISVYGMVKWWRKKK